MIGIATFLAACSTDPNVKQYTEVTAANILALKSGIKTFQSQNLKLVVLRTNTVKDIHRTYYDISQDVSIFREGINPGEKRNESRETLYNALLRASDQRATEAEVLDQMTKNIDLELRVLTARRVPRDTALANAIKQLGELGDDGDLRSRGKFLVEFLGSVLKDVSKNMKESKGAEDAGDKASGS